MQPTISRDGKLLAYSSDRGGGTNLDIWVQQMVGGQPVRLTRHEAPDLEPDFSPDGASIVFHSTRDGGGVYVIPTLGGEVERKVADRGRWPRFSPDGKWIAYQISGAGGTGRGAKLFVVPSAGGQPRQLVAHFQSVGPAMWSPDGRALLVGSFHPTTPPSQPAWDWWAAPLDGAPPVRTGIYKRLWEQGVRLTEPGDWVQEYFYVSGGRTVDFLNVWRVPLSSKTWQAAGAPERITSGTSRNDSARVSMSGVLVCTSRSGNINVWTLPVDANQAKVTGKLEQLTRDAGWGRNNILSVDGRKLVYNSETKGGPNLGVHEIDSGKSSVVPTGSQPGIPRKITADGAGVIYRAIENQKPVVYRAAMAGGTPQKLCEDCCLFDVSADDQRILGCMSPSQRPAGCFLDVTNGRKTQLWKSPKHALGGFALSPDDRWVAMQATMPTERTQLFAMPLRPGGPPAEEKDWVAITDGNSEDSSPSWSPDGRVLYFISERDGQPCVWARRFDPKTGQPSGEAFALQHMHTPSLRIWYGTTMAVARDKIALRLGDNRSNIWMVKLP
jgi:Tol biopolymer transport system component